MAGDKKQYQRALARWYGHKTSDRLSAPDTEGYIAIGASNYPVHYMKRGHEGIDADDEDICIFEQEARDIADGLGAIGLKTEVILGLCTDNMTDILNDTEISSVIVIGHGSISDIRISGAANGIYDWKAASEDATHLKQGTFIQRQCGIFRRRLNVPLGYFTVDDPRFVRAAVGEVFQPESYLDKSNLINPVTDLNLPVSYEAIQELFPLFVGD